jgi:peptide subunit release factor 1 (eRF1)
MEHRGTTSFLRIPTDDLRPLVEGSAPMATVLLGTDPAEANPGPRWAQRWKTARRGLEGLGAHPGALARLDEAADDAYRHGDAFYAIADADRLWVAEEWPGPVRHEVMRWAPLPSLAPLLGRRQRQVPHVVALVDREGADVVTVERDGAAREREVDGEHGAVIRKSAPGGWSQRRYQDRAEESWARTARDIAEVVSAAADRVDARLVALAGDVREVQLVRDALPTRLTERVHVVEGGRAPGTDEAARTHEIDRLLDTTVADATVALVRKVREELGQHDRAVVGAEATMDALRKGQVEVLLVHDDPADERTAAFGQGATALATDASALPRDDRPQTARLVDVVVRAAIGTGADVRVVPSVHALPDGLGAILRWTDTS